MKPSLRLPQLLLPLVSAIACVVVANQSARAQTPQGMLFQGEVGIPKFRSEAGPSVAGAAKLGYGWSQFGMEGQASHLVEDTDDENGDLTEILRTSFGASAWYASGTPATMRFEARLEAYALFYSSTNFSNAPTATDQNSEFTRFAAMAGIRSPQEQRLYWGLLAGLGPQFESHSSHANQGQSETTYDESFVYRFRADARYRIIPDSLVMRGRSELAAYQLSRTVYGTGGGFVDIEQTGIDLMNRVYLDVPAWSFLGLEPGIFAGLDLFMRRGSQANSTSWVPIAGLATSTPF